MRSVSAEQTTLLSELEPPSRLHISHWIDGSSVTGTSGRTSPVFDPATGKVSADLDLASVSEVDAAVASATAANLFSPAGRSSIQSGLISRTASSKDRVLPVDDVPSSRTSPSRRPSRAAARCALNPRLPRS